MYIYIASIGTACVFYLNALLCFPIDFKNSYRDIPCSFFFVILFVKVILVVFVAETSNDVIIVILVLARISNIARTIIHEACILFNVFGAFNTNTSRCFFLWKVETNHRYISIMGEMYLTERVESYCADFHGFFC